MAKDFFNNELNIGDTVAFMEIKYRSLKSGVIIKITDKMVIIEYEKQYVGITQTKQFHGQVIKKEKLTLDLTDRNNDLIKENKRLQDELMDLMINVFGEIERRQTLILREDNDLIRDTMINNLLIDIPRADGGKFNHQTNL